MNEIQRQGEHILEVNMLGGLSMKYGQTPISLEGKYFSKSTQLFLLLLLNQETGINKKALTECLYGPGEENKGKNNNNLNNMICRLRKQLRELGLPKEDAILTKGGCCRYVSSSPIKVDIRELEGFLEKAEAPGTEPQERRACLLEAVRLYQGELLPEAFAKAWVVEERMRCKTLYEGALGQLGQILSQEGSFEELYQLYSHAARLYPLEHWQKKQMECLMAMGQKEKAVKLYQETEYMYKEQLGVTPSDTYQKLLREMEYKLSKYPKGLDRIQQELHEDHREPGAYYCSFPSFLDSSRVLARMMERNKKAAILLMCTLKDHAPEERAGGGNYGAKRRAKWLRQSIGDSLRREDFYTRYSPCQYLALLPGTGQEDAFRVMSRIDRKYQELSKSTEKEIRYDIIAPGAEREKIGSAALGDGRQDIGG